MTAPLHPLDLIEKACKAWDVDLTDMVFRDGQFQGKASYRGEAIAVCWPGPEVFAALQAYGLDASLEATCSVLNTIVETLVKAYKEGKPYA